MTKRLLVLGVLVAVLALPIANSVAQEGENIQITFWHAFGGGRMLFIERMVEDFNYTHPGIEVQVEYKGSYRETLNAAILAAEQGNAPHVVQIFEVGTQLALDTGIFIPAEDIVGENVDLLMLDDIIAPVRNYYTVNGKLNSFPWNSSNPILYYNRDMFEAAGLDPDNPPMTFEDVEEVCQTFRETGVAEACITWPLHSWFFEQWMAEQGALLADNDNGRAGRATEVYLDGDAARRIFEWWTGLYADGYYVYSGSLEDWDGANAIFISQQVPMLITSTSDVNFMQNAANENGFAIGTSYIPVPADVERNGVIIGGASLWLTADHPQEELDAALEFVLWMGNTENAVRWHKGTGYFPVRNSAVWVLEQQNWFETHPLYRAAFDQLLETQVNSATAGAILGPFLEIRTMIEEAIQSVMVEGVSVDEALANLDEMADEAVAEYNAGVEE